MAIEHDKPDEASDADLDATTEQRFTRRKAQDRALILPFVGFFFLATPVASLFLMETRIAGIPFTVLYLFAMWGALIIGAALLSRTLSHDDTISDANEANSSTLDRPR